MKSRENLDKFMFSGFKSSNSIGHCVDSITKLLSNSLIESDDDDNCFVLITLAFYNFIFIK